MKKILFVIMGLAIGFVAIAQVPEAFKFQAVVRDGSGSIMPNRNISFRISLIEDGTWVYVENHVSLTNEFGLVNLEIGNGTTVSGSFRAINWASGQHFLKIEMDPVGGGAYYLMGTNELLSVPYALHAKTVEQDQVDDADADPANEIQELQLSGTQLTLTRGGGTVTLPSGGGGDNWGNQTVLTDISLTGDGTTVSPLKIAENSINSGKIIDGSVSNADINDGAVNSSKIQDGSVTGVDLANAAVTTDKLALNAVTTEKISSGAVTGAKIAQSGATSGQALKWSGTAWAPADDNAGGLTFPFNGTATLEVPVFNISNLGTSGAISTFSAGNYGIWGESSNSTGIGIYGVNKNSTGGTTYGVFGEVYSSNGFSGYFQGGKVFIEGNTGLGTQNPGAKLEVNGQVKITGGSPGSGKVLTSDASGLASWGAPASGFWTKSDGSLYYTDGNVGIGTTSPYNRLTIYANDQSGVDFHNSGSGTNALDGFFVGITHGGSNPPAWLWNYENSNLYFGTNNTYRMVINSDGQVDVKGRLNINSDVPEGQALWVYGKEALWFNGTYFSWGYDAAYNYFADPISIGNLSEPTGYLLWVQGDAWATGYWLRSDLRVKKNIKPIENALDRLMKVKGSSFEFRRDEFDDCHFSEGTQFGLIAQELEPVFPEMVKTEKDGFKSVNYNGMIPILVEAIKEQQRTIENLEVEIERLKARIGN
jgi:hypothetical protein